MKPDEFLRRRPENRPEEGPGRRRILRRQRPPRAAAERGGGPASLVWSRGKHNGGNGSERAATAPTPGVSVPSDPRRRNRLKPNIPRILLRSTLVLLAAECAAALLFSPRLWVRTLRVEGNHTVAAARIFERTGLRPQTNLVSLNTGRIRRRVEREPSVASAEVIRRLPDTLIVHVRERTPRATVKIGDVCYTVDETLIPFHKDRTPRPDLPLIVLAEGSGKALLLGKQIQTRGIQQAKKCLVWAASNPEFPLAKVTVDPGGKLCLNRSNGAEVQLGTGKDLDKKLNALALLIQQRPDVRAGNFAYMNLYAYDAPALHPRAESVVASPLPQEADR